MDKSGDEWVDYGGEVLNLEKGTTCGPTAVVL